MAQSVAMSVLAGVISVLAVVGYANSATVEHANPPWYPSLAAFEHYDSGRSHLFAQATFGGQFSGNNTVTTLKTHTGYPSGWNITYLDADNAFLYSGGSGDDPSSIGAYVAKIDPQTLEPIWYKQLIDTAQNGEWDYPGTLAILDDGFLYVIYGYRLSKLHPSNGHVIATLVLPTGDAAPADTTFNGFRARQWTHAPIGSICSPGRPGKSSSRRAEKSQDSALGAGEPSNRCSPAIICCAT
jgi:hypothetical protein